VRHVLFLKLQKYTSSDWRIMEETPLSQTNLRLQPVAIALVQQAGREVKDSETQTGQIHISKWQPDIIGISFAKRKIAIGPEVTIPSDSRPQALIEAHDRKIKSYMPLVAALQDYVDSGWTVCVIPWVIGARGMVRHDQLMKALEFLEIPQQKCKTIIDCTVRASVEGLAYMHRIRFSASNQHNVFDTDDPKVIAANQEKLLSAGRKRKIQKDADDLRAMHQKWQRLVDSSGNFCSGPTVGDR